MKYLKRSPAAFARLITFSVLLFTGAGAMPASKEPTSGPEQIIAFLDQTLVWHKQLTTQQQLVSEPSDVVFLNDNRQIAGQVVRLSFDFARSAAQAMSSKETAGNATATTGQANPAASRYQVFFDMAAKADQQVKQLQGEIDSFQQQLKTATGQKRRLLQSTLEETKGELELQQARSDAMRNMLQFISGTAGPSSGDLSAEIEELARTAPDVLTETGRQNEGQPASSANNNSTPVAVAATQKKDTPTGILAIITDLFALRRKVHAMDDTLRLTDSLEKSINALRAPLVSDIRTLEQQGDQLASAADVQNDPAVLAQQKKDLDALTVRFKQVSATFLPLGKEVILLDLYKRSTSNWRSAIASQYSTQLKNLILRLAVLGIILGVILGFSELWRRTIFRYVHDVRRRYQFLLLRRIVIWCLAAIIVAVSFASELGALTTFAGLLTAGIAVALQNVILSVAGYFFLIGKYGVRIGDRIQISGVTGDVVDIGLVRLHLMEIGSGSGPRATGRVVVFSNAVVFQPTAGLFKQIPGTNFVWHEITLTLAAESDYRQVEKRMLEAVNRVFAGYKEKMESQRQSIERTLATRSAQRLNPEGRLHLTPGGMEVIIRYPVELENASEIDDKITRELLAEVERDPKLRVIGSSTSVSKTESP